MTDNNSSINNLIATFSKITAANNSTEQILDTDNILCIDTCNNRIGINTIDPSYAIHVLANNSDIESGKISTVNLITDKLELRNNENINIEGNVKILGDISCTGSLISNKLHFTSRENKDEIVYIDHVDNKTRHPGFIYYDNSYGTNILWGRNNIQFKTGSQDPWLIPMEISSNLVQIHKNLELGHNRLVFHSVNMRYYNNSLHGGYRILETTIGETVATKLSRQEVNQYISLEVYGNVYATGHSSSTFSLLTSDDRIKHNEQDISNSLHIIRQLNPKKYQKTQKMYQADYTGDISGHWQYEAGLIAQDILAIPDLSYCVSGGDEIDSSGNIIEKPYNLNYNNIFTYGLAAIKELDILCKSQQTEIASLKQENIDTKIELNKLKKELNELLVLAGKQTI